MRKGNQQKELLVQSAVKTRGKPTHSKVPQGNGSCKSALAKAPCGGRLSKSRRRPQIVAAHVGGMFLSTQKPFCCLPATDQSLLLMGPFLRES